MKILIFEPKSSILRAFKASHQILLEEEIKELVKYAEIVVVTEQIHPTKYGKRDIDIREKEGYVEYQVRGLFSYLSNIMSPKTHKMSMIPEFFSPDILNKIIRLIKYEIAPDVIYSSGSPLFGLFTYYLQCKTATPAVYYVFYPLYESPKGELTEGKVSPNLLLSIYELFKELIRNIPRRKILIKWALNGISQLVVSSRYVLQSLFKIGLTSRDIPIIYPGIRVPSLGRKVYPLEDPLLTYFGHFRARRGVLDVLITFVHVAPMFPNLKLLLAISNLHDIFGSSLFNFYKYLIGKLRLEDRVILKGAVKDIYLEVLFPSAVVLLPQREASIKILEAMASARPVITTNVEWIPELIKSGFNGFLTDPGDIKEMTKIVSSLLKNPNIAEKVGKYARATIEKKCNIVTHAKNLLNIMLNTRRKASI